MRAIRDQSIKRKLTLLSMLTSGLALLLACAALLVHELVTFPSAMRQELAIIADMYDDGVGPGLTFNDASSVEQTLSTLSGHPRILGACVFDNEGKNVAGYRRKDMRHFEFPKARAAGQAFQEGRLETFKEIIIGGEKMGTLFVACDLTELSSRLKRYGITAGLIMAVSALAAYLISARLQQFISAPILALAQVARKVAAGKDYSVRAQEGSGDEMGELTRGFNEMLSQIQKRDAELELSREQLEKRVAERTAELAASVSLLNATLDSTADGILARELSGKVTCYNRKFIDLWGFDKEIIQGRDSKELLKQAARQVKDPEAFVGLASRVNGSLNEDFDIVELKDGRTLERYVHPQIVNGEKVGVVVNLRDITQRKRAQEDIETMHKELLETSRKAGMAEVATGVLHNVGNVLNSVNVTTSVIGDKIKKSKVPSLMRLSELLKEQRDLNAFVANDPRGKLLPTFLDQLAGSISAEQRTIAEELTQLQKNVEHIKDIVAMQQSYAKVAGVSERVELKDLVEDSLRMNSGSLERHGVKVVKRFEETPALNLEKHKVLQILVNLIRNAKYACDDSNRDDKQITLWVRQENGKARITVSDNGIGIPKENLTRIFAHGFTTRSNGHGFGLHSGALAAKEMDGSLLAASDGLGCGATFTLELPIRS